MSPVTSTASPPEPGQIVRVRRRQFVVQEVTKGTLPGPPQHHVSLASVEDDALGEALDVVWEAEVGAQAVERIALPRPDPARFDAPDRLEAFLLAVRWGAASTADIRALQAPYRSGIEIEDYQLEPVARAIEMPRVNLLIADDVGLGKTIEAGLVVQELLVRHRARRVLVVCPATLQIQWRDQMREKFGLEFKIVNAAYLKDLRRRRGLQANPWQSYPRLIASIDYLKRERPMRLFRADLPADGDVRYPRKWDILIVDEAHNVAPPGRARLAVDSDRTRCIREISRHFEHRLFLTATPHNGFPESFAALLELLDDQRFTRGVVPSRARLQSAMVRRLKADLPPHADGTPRFTGRSIRPIEVPFTDDEREIHAWLDRYADLRRAAVERGGDAERFAVNFALTLLKKRLLSSPAAFYLSIEKHVETLAKAGGDEAARPTLRALEREADEAEAESEDDERREERAGAALHSASLLFPSLSKEENDLLKKMRAAAARRSKQEDSKAAALIEFIRRNPDDRLIVFTEYRATQNYLLGLLAQHGIEGDRVETLYGGQDPDDRERVKAAFQASPTESPVRLLVATDAAAEGLDLQNHCHRLIHYEIPWNPNRLEQRNGRVHRHGQRSDVEIHHFVCEGWDDAGRTDRATADYRFIKTVVEKVEQIREDLGAYAPVIARQIEEAMLGLNRRSAIETAPVDDRARRSRDEIRFEEDVRKRITRLRARLDGTREALELSPDRVRRVVEEGLRLAGFLGEGEVLAAADVPGLAAGTAFHAPDLPGTWAETLAGLDHPYTGARRPIVFDADAVKGRQDVVLAHLEHPLVRRTLALLRAEVWKHADGSLSRVTARSVPAEHLSDPAVVVHARLVLLSHDHKRLHEELVTVGASLATKKPRRMAQDRLERALAAAGGAPKRLPAGVVTGLVDGFDDLQAPVLRDLLDERGDEVTADLRVKLDTRAKKEADDIERIIDEQIAAVRERISQGLPTQIDLFDKFEEDQARRDLAHLEYRLKQLEAERRDEPEAIRLRYQVAVPRLFPVALTYLVPEAAGR